MFWDIKRLKNMLSDNIIIMHIYFSIFAIVLFSLVSIAT